MRTNILHTYNIHVYITSNGMYISKALYLQTEIRIYEALVYTSNIYDYIVIIRR
jgi:hypothetical protein